MLLKDEKAWEETLFRMSKKQGAHITGTDVEKAGYGDRGRLYLWDIAHISEPIQYH